MRDRLSRWAIVLWCGVIGAACSGTQTVLPDGGGADLAQGARSDLATGGDDLASVGADLSTGGGDLSTVGADLAGTSRDLAGEDLSAAASDMTAAASDMTGASSDLKTNTDLTSAPQDLAPGCGATTAQPTVGYTNGTFTSNSVLTFAVAAGYHARGTLTLPTLPAGSSLDAVDCFAIFVDTTSGARFDATVTASSANAVSYDAVLPACTYDFNWGFTVKYVGSSFLGRQDIISNVVICGDHTQNVTVPSFGTVVVATVNVSALNNFGTSPSGSFDAIVEMHDAQQLYFAEGSQLAIPSATTTAAITMPLPMAVAMTPYVLGRVTGYDTAPGDGYFQTRVAFVPAIAGQTVYSLAIPTMGTISGSLGASADRDSGYYAAFNCFAPGNDIYGEFTSVYYLTSFSTPYRPGGSCAPYTAAPVIVSATAVNENSDGLLDLPDPNKATLINVVGGTNAVGAAGVPTIATVTVLGSLTDALGNPLPSYTVSARSSSLTPAAFANQRFRAEGGAPFGAVTDSSGNFKLHLIAGSYSLVANP